MTISVDVREPSRRIALITVAGEIDYATAADVRQAVSEAINTIQPTRILVDIAGVHLIDSTGVGILVVAYRICRQLGIEFSVRNQTDLVDRVLRALGVRDILVAQAAEERTAPVTTS